MLQKEGGFFSNRLRGLLIGLGIASLASYLLIVASTQPATAHQDPANCNTNSVGISLTPFISGVPTAGPVQHGDVITYQVTLSVPAGAGAVIPCSVDGGQLSVTLPNGTVVQVAGFGGSTPNVPLVSSVSPYIVNAPTTYTVAHANEDGGFNLTARADYGSTVNQPVQTNGTFHAGVHQQTASATTSNVLHVIHNSTVATQVHNANHTDITNGSVPIGEVIHDKAIVTGAAGTPTGTVDFARYTNDACTGNPATIQNDVALAGDGTAESNTFTTNAVGGLSYKVHYDGDTNYLPGAGPCEPLTITKLNSTTTSEVHNPNHTDITNQTVPVGTIVHDKAIVAGSGATPTGTVDFKRFTNKQCSGSPANTQSGVSLAGSPATAESSNFTTVAGDMAYQVHYNGDSIYNSSDGPCEPLHVETPQVGCTLTQGYWKNHESAWPVNSLTLGTTTYTKAQLLSILKTPVKGNGLVSLSHQLIAAKLNIANGASNSSIAATIVSADALIGTKVVPPVGSGSISPSTASSLTNLLDQFNNGAIGPGHCED